jgi:hypothetical protein
MNIADWLYLVGSGRSGFRLTDDYDCHVYLLDGGGGAYALIDAGSGRDVAASPTRSRWMGWTRGRWGKLC